MILVFTPKMAYWGLKIESGRFLELTLYIPYGQIGIPFPGAGLSCICARDLQLIQRGWKKHCNLFTGVFLAWSIRNLSFSS